MSKITRYLGCDTCIHREHKTDENYLCKKRMAWIWPWLITLADETQLPECDYYQCSGEKVN